MSRGSNLTSLLVALCLVATSAVDAQARRSKKAAGPKAGHIELTDRSVELNGGISATLIRKAQSKVLEFDGQSHEPIWLLINSGGGSVEAGLVLIDTMEGIESPIHCVVESKAYSMAAIILAFCDKRYAMNHATIMLHEASYGTAGEDPSNRSRLDFLTRYLDGLHVEIAARLGMPVVKYRARIRDAWWLLASEAAKSGVVDEVVTTIGYTELPLAKTVEKTTMVVQGESHHLEEPGDGGAIPKRRD